MKIVLISFLFVTNCLGQGFTFRNIPFIGNLTPVVSVNNNPVFNNVTHVWHLDEASGSPRVDSVGSKTLTETVATPNATGIHVNAADFRGGTTRSMATVNWTLSAPFTIAYWVKFTDAVIPNDLKDIFYKDETSGDGVVFARLNSNLTQNFVQWQVGAIGDSFTGAAISQNVWHLHVVTVDAGDVGIEYIDGVNTDGGTVALTTSDLDVTLGNKVNGAAGVLVDELMIWNVALTQANVTTLWNSGAGTFYSP